MSHAKLFFVTISVLLIGCVPEINVTPPNRSIPSTFGDSKDADNLAKLNWKDYFQDKFLKNLIEQALSNNQELKIFLQDLEVAKNEVSAKSGAYLPFLELGASNSLEKSGRFTRNGALEEEVAIAPNKSFPEPLRNVLAGARASWEVDIWHKLRDAEKSALSRFLASSEGRNFLITNLIAEIAHLYFELRALDSQLNIVRQNIETQTSALQTVRLEKQGARVTELALKRFEAQVLETRSIEFQVQQRIVETENRINFLLGRFPQSVERDTQPLNIVVPDLVKVGVPSQLLQNRPDIRQAELNIAAAELDIKVAKAAFYPSLTISADLGYQAYRLSNLIKTPDSLFYSLSEGITGPLINRRAISADYYNANNRQKSAVFAYERTVLNAFVEVSNQIANISNLNSKYSLLNQQVEALADAVNIANTLFLSARADYTEVLLTQRDALEARFGLVETKLQQLAALVNIYRAIGGGWS